MSKILVSFILGICITIFFAFKVINYDPKPKTAEVNEVEGLLIFTDSSPVLEYEYLGTVKSNTGGLGNPQYEGVRSRLIKNTKKEFPQADGIILNLRYGSADKADVIKFKTTSR